jgi:hypothetical protein
LTRETQKEDAKLRVPLKEAQALISQQIEEGEELLKTPAGWPREALQEFRSDVQIWHAVSEQVLRRCFTTTQFVDEFTHRGPNVLVLDLNTAEEWDDDKRDLRQQITRLRAIKGRLPLIEVLCTPMASAKKSRNPKPGRKVFVVHGHHEESKHAVARRIDNLRLKAVILDEQTSLSKTVIEKLERYSDVAFAVVLLTPDDVGAPKRIRRTLRRL